MILSAKDLALTDPRFPPADPSRLIEFSNSYKLAGRGFTNERHWTSYVRR
jgi:hypothetical protein